MTAHAELDQLADRLNRLLDLVVRQAQKIDVLQDALTLLMREHADLLAERERLSSKIETAQSQVQAILEQLPVDELSPHQGDLLKQEVTS